MSWEVWKSGLPEENGAIMGPNKDAEAHGVTSSLAPRAQPASQPASQAGGENRQAAQRRSGALKGADSSMELALKTDASLP